MTELLVFAGSNFVFYLMFAMVMSTIQTLGERHKIGYGQRVWDWWNSNKRVLEMPLFCIGLGLSCLVVVVFHFV